MSGTGALAQGFGTRQHALVEPGAVRRADIRLLLYIFEAPRMGVAHVLGRPQTQGTGRIFHAVRD